MVLRLEVTTLDMLNGKFRVAGGGVKKMVRGRARESMGKIQENLLHIAVSGGKREKEEMLYTYLRKFQHVAEINIKREK